MSADATTTAAASKHAVAPCEQLRALLLAFVFTAGASTSTSTAELSVVLEAHRTRRRAAASTDAAIARATQRRDETLVVQHAAAQSSTDVGFEGGGNRASDSSSSRRRSSAGAGQRWLLLWSFLPMLLFVWLSNVGCQPREVGELFVGDGFGSEALDVERGGRWATGPSWRRRRRSIVRTQHEMRIRPDGNVGSLVGAQLNFAQPTNKHTTTSAHTSATSAEIQNKLPRPLCTIPLIAFLTLLPAVPVRVAGFHLGCLCSMRRVELVQVHYWSRARRGPRRWASAS